MIRRSLNERFGRRIDSLSCPEKSPWNPFLTDHGAPSREITTECDQFTRRAREGVRRQKRQGFPTVGCGSGMTHSLPLFDIPGQVDRTFNR